MRFHHEVLPRSGVRHLLAPTELRRTASASTIRCPQISEVERNPPGTVLELLDTEKLLLDSSHRSVNIACCVQAIVHQQNKELREMEEDHGRNPEVFDDLLRIDHGTALIGRRRLHRGARRRPSGPQLAQARAVVQRDARRDVPDPRYRRIELHSIADVNVNGIHVEPVIHAVAELLDNATRYSPPNSKVHLTALKVQTGVAIEIEDSGVSFSDEARGKMEELLRQAAAGTDLQVLARPRGSASPSSASFSPRCTTWRSRSASPRTAVSARSWWCRATCSPRTPQPPSPTASARTPPRPWTPTGSRGPTASPTSVARPPDPASPAGRRVQGRRRPPVTEWTPNGLPQRRSRVKIPLRERYAEGRRLAAEEAAAAAAPSWGTAPAAPRSRRRRRRSHRGTGSRRSAGTQA